MRKRISAGIAFIFLFVTLTGATAFAQTSEQNILYPETEEMIIEIESQYGIDKSYFEDIVDMYFDNGYSDQNELNTAIQDAVRQMRITCEQTELEYQAALNTYQKKSNNYNKSSNNTNSAYSMAIQLYRMGISVVEIANCPYTAQSMEHAIVPESQVGTGWAPGRLHYDNNSWSTFLITTQEFWQKIEGQFQYELGSGKNVITCSGTHAFTQANSSLDAYVQLHNVNYTVTFVKTSNGGYTGNFLISDTYDFDWTNYDNIFVGFGNNYCKMAQDAGYIAPYPIYISGKM